jgi:ABC-type lipoprotein export system ATPase subunit
LAQIALHDITKTYAVGDDRIIAVRAASLEIERGDFLSIVGHSGSGKTTLLSLIGGITMPTSGTVLFDGLDISTLGSDPLSEYRSLKVGFMFQFASLLPMLTIRENLLLPTAFTPRQGGLRSRAASKASDLLRMVGLLDKRNHYPAQLSGGQQRRVAIARAFMNEPVLILADEPTGDLDEETEQEMMDFFKTMNRNEGTTFIMVTHNSDLAKQAQRHFRMLQGIIQKQ